MYSIFGALARYDLLDHSVYGETVTKDDRTYSVFSTLCTDCGEDGQFKAGAVLSIDIDRYQCRYLYHVVLSPLPHQQLGSRIPNMPLAYLITLRYYLKQ